MIKTLADKLRYAKWRSTIPFSNEEIARAFEEEIEIVQNDARLNESRRHYLVNRYQYRARRIREGFLSHQDITEVIGKLIKTCAICGKKALYRQGAEGRCSAHRHILNTNVRKRRERLHTQQAEISDYIKEHDGYDMSHRHANRTGKFGKSRPRG